MASGVRDGEARRLADQARLQCEAAKGGIPTSPAPEFACADDPPGLEPPSDDPGVIGVYYSCRADFALFGLPDQPVYLAIRQLPESAVEDLSLRLERAIRWYMAGPRPDELERGYFTPTNHKLAESIQGVSVREDVATIDFSPNIQSNLGNLGTTTALDIFVIELSATAFQFDGIEKFMLTVDGSCEEFWALFARTCSVITAT